MTIGLICALPQEHAHLETAMGAAATQEMAGVLFSVGELDGHPMVLSRAGLGKVWPKKALPRRAQLVEGAKVIIQLTVIWS